MTEFADAIWSEDDGENLTRLLELGLDPNAPVHGYTPLHYAAMTDGADSEPERKIRILLKHGADPNARSDVMWGDAWTPLHLAAYEGQPSAIEALLAGGADPELVTADGDTAFDLSLDPPTVCSLERVRVLVEHGARRQVALERARSIRSWYSARAEQILVMDDVIELLTEEPGGGSLG